MRMLLTLSRSVSVVAVDVHDGIVAVVEALSGHPLFAHVTLSRSERSAVAALVGRMLDE